MLSAFCAMMHNSILLKDCEKTLNSFINMQNSRIWFEDESGQRFVPHGQIKICSIEMVQTIIKEEIE